MLNHRRFLLLLYLWKHVCVHKEKQSLQHFCLHVLDAYDLSGGALFHRAIELYLEDRRPRCKNEPVCGEYLPANSEFDIHALFARQEITTLLVHVRWWHHYHRYFLSVDILHDSHIEPDTERIVLEML
uniref:Secreted protein n=1 Tax=Arundo donax TaxID=35708 RepID=A0A0A9C390_ARUDO